MTEKEIAIQKILLLDVSNHLKNAVALLKLASDGEDPLSKDLNIMIEAIEELVNG